jgi:hypothetical protein
MRRWNHSYNAEAYLDAAGIRDEESPLFRGVDKHRRITPNRISPTDVPRMVGSSEVKLLPKLFAPRAWARVDFVGGPLS